MTVLKNGYGFEGHEGEKLATGTREEVYAYGEAENRILGSAADALRAHYLGVLGLTTEQAEGLSNRNIFQAVVKRELGEI